MPNSYFKFKQFTIHQDKCAMKVCTDACLFGALLPAINEKSALDIGAGTGLLSLMFAQKNTGCFLDAIEIDEAAYEQASQNIDESIYKKNINTYCLDIKTFYPEKKYDLIFSNPPFYINDLKGNDVRKNMAMHATSLSYGDLLQSAERLVNIDGKLVLLVPFSIEETVINIAQQHKFFPYKIVRAKQTEKHSFFRSIVFFSTTKTELTQNEIIIKISNEYSEEFKKLLKDYYLFL